MEKFIEFIQESIKTIEDKDLTQIEAQMVASRLDSVCALLSITIYNLKQTQNEES